MLTTFEPASATTSPLFVAATAAGLSPGANLASTLICTPSPVAPCAEATNSSTANSVTTTANDDIEVDFSELPGLLFYCETLGTEAGSRLGMKPHSSEKTEQALREVAEQLHIDHGESWAKLLEELH